MGAYPPASSVRTLFCLWSVTCISFFFFFLLFFFLLNFPGKSTPVSQLGSADFPDSPDPFQPLGADSSDPFQNKRGFGDPFSGKDPFAPSSSAKPSKASSLGFADFTSVSWVLHLHAPPPLRLQFLWGCVFGLHLLVLHAIAHVIYSVLLLSVRKKKSVSQIKRHRGFDTLWWGHMSWYGGRIWWLHLSVPACPFPGQLWVFSLVRRCLCSLIFGSRDVRHFQSIKTELLKLLH